MENSSPDRSKTKGLQEESESTQDIGDQDLNDLLQELRILLQGCQVLTAFLIILPFSEGFTKIDQTEKWVYLATFVCSISSLVVFSAPAAYHRLARPIINKSKFKNLASKIMILGQVPLTLALALSAQFVVREVEGFEISLIVSGLVGLLILTFWWVLPLIAKNRL